MYFLPQNSTLTIEEFHSKLQEATNFPLRPFVIPFLKVRTHPSPLVAGPTTKPQICDWAPPLALTGPWRELWEQC